MHEPFLVMNGDVLTRFNSSQLLRFHAEQAATGTLCVREHTTIVPFGVVQTNGVELAGFAEKPSYRQLVNAGVYVIDPETFASAAASASYRYAISSAGRTDGWSSNRCLSDP